MRGKAKGEKGGLKEKMKNFCIVLAGPQSSGNVGSVARAMKNTGFSKLDLVNPCDYMNNEAWSMACKADDVLKNATVHTDLRECVKDSGLIVGTTRRMGRGRYPVMTLKEAAPKILEMGRNNAVSLLFGREDRGLLNDEIPLCDMLVEIPTAPEYPSINLSHAVFIVCYELFSLTEERAPVVVAAPSEEKERMYVHLEQALRALGYGEQGGEYLLTAIMRSFKRLFGRTGLMQKEINMLRGIFTQIEERTY
jgi:tRNA/rRNA methyltransferase